MTTGTTMPDWMVEVWSGDGKLLVIGCVVSIVIVCVYFGWEGKR